MDGNGTQQLPLDSQEVQQVMGQVLGEAIKSISRPKVPLWLEAVLDFVRIHPWVSLFILLGAMAVIFAIIREMICSYLKTNEILVRLKRLEEKTK